MPVESEASNQVTAGRQVITGKRTELNGQWRVLHHISYTFPNLKFPILNPEVVSKRVSYNDKSNMYIFIVNYGFVVDCVIVPNSSFLLSSRIIHAQAFPSEFSMPPTRVGRVCCLPQWCAWPWDLICLWDLSRYNVSRAITCVRVVCLISVCFCHLP